MKKNLLLVAGIVAGEILFWTLCEVDYYRVFSFVGAVVAIVFAFKLIRSTKRAAFKPVIRRIAYVLCAAVIAGQFYGWAWVRSRVQYPVHRVKVVDAVQTNGGKYNMTLKDEDGRLYEVLFSAEGGEQLRAAPSGTYDVFIVTHALRPKCTTGDVVKQNQS